MYTLVVKRDFCMTPGPRYRNEGPHSGEEFLEQVLAPAFHAAAILNGEPLTVDLDGGYGYGVGFLDTAFGGLAQKYGFEALKKSLILKSQEEPYLIEDIWRFINERFP